MYYNIGIRFAFVSAPFWSKFPLNKTLKEVARR